MNCVFFCIAVTTYLFPKPGFSATFNPKNKKRKLHRHPAFFGTMKECIEDCCEVGGAMSFMPNRGADFVYSTALSQQTTKRKNSKKTKINNISEVASRES